MTTNGIYEKTPSLSLRLRVEGARETRKTNSNILEWHSSLFELIRGHGRSALLEYRMNSNFVEYPRTTPNDSEVTGG